MKLIEKSEEVCLSQEEFIDEGLEVLQFTDYVSVGNMGCIVCLQSLVNIDINNIKDESELKNQKVLIKLEECGHIVHQSCLKENKSCSACGSDSNGDLDKYNKYGLP